MITITIQEARANLSEWIHRLAPGEEAIITEDGRPIARLVPAPAAPSGEARKVPMLGTLRGTVRSMDHFDDPLEEFEDYR